MKKLLTAAQIAQVLGQMLEKILPDVSKDKNFAVIGIRSRGEILAERLCTALSEKTGRENGTGSDTDIRKQGICMSCQFV